MTLVEMLKTNSVYFPAKPAIIYHGEVIRYGELWEIVCKIACALKGMGLQKGDRVGLMMPRTPELVESFLAAAVAGAVAAPINFELSSADVGRIITGMSPRFIFVHENYLELAKRSLPEDAGVTLITPRKGHGFYSIEEAASLASVFEDAECAAHDDDTVYLNYTSGSTGGSKGAVTTNANIYWNTLSSVMTLGMGPDDVHFCLFAPFAHPHEIFARPLYLGGTMVLLDNIYPKSIAESIEKNRVTCMMGLSPMFQKLLDVLNHKDYDLSSLRIAESGGMFTRTELVDAFEKRLGVRITPVWGSTETTGIALASRPGSDTPAGSVGKPCYFYNIRLVDDDGRDVERGEVGELIFNGPAVVSGYRNSGDQVQFRDGWYYSGDLARQDENGYYYFVERKTGMMKVAGLKVYPMEIENMLLENPAVAEAAVVSVDDRLRGEVAKAFVVPRDASCTERDFLNFLKQRLPHYKIPKIIEIRQELPKIGSGKVNRKILKAEHL